MENEYLFHYKSGLFYRDETLDLFVIGEQLRSYRSFLELCKDKIVLDLGANIGAFSKRASEYEAKKL